MAEIKKTEKQDWLNDFIASCGNNYFVSGHKTFSERLGLKCNSDIEINMAIRFYGNVKIGYEFIITAIVEKEQWNQIFEQNREAILRFVDSIKNAFQANAFFLFCEPESKKENFFAIVNTRNINISFDEMNFTYNVNMLRLDIVNDLELQSFFCNIHEQLMPDSNQPIIKEINKSINDSFQVWTRAYLSRFITVNDIDTIRLNPIALYELKRIEEDVLTWEPYLDDRTNYSAISRISNHIGVQFRTIAYNVNYNFVALHIITDIQKDVITGYRNICRPFDAINGGEWYKSQKWRQKSRY